MRYVRYHSDAWMILVSNGWVTATVSNGIATMVRESK